MAALLVLATICRRPVTLTFDLLTLKSLWESHVTWGTPVQSFVFLGLLVFELEPIYATSDGQTDGRTTDADHRIMPPRRGHNNGMRPLNSNRCIMVVFTGSLYLDSWLYCGHWRDCSDLYRSIYLQYTVSYNIAIFLISVNRASPVVFGHTVIIIIIII